MDRAPWHPAPDGWAGLPSNLVLEHLEPALDRRVLQVYPVYNFQAIPGTATPLGDQWLALVEGQEPLPEAVEVSLGAGWGRLQRSITRTGSQGPAAVVLQQETVGAWPQAGRRLPPWRPWCRWQPPPLSRPRQGLRGRQARTRPLWSHQVRTGCVRRSNPGCLERMQRNS